MKRLISVGPARGSFGSCGRLCSVLSLGLVIGDVADIKSRCCLPAPGTCVNETRTVCDQFGGTFKIGSLCETPNIECASLGQ